MVAQGTDGPARAAGALVHNLRGILQVSPVHLVAATRIAALRRSIRF